MQNIFTVIKNSGIYKSYIRRGGFSVLTRSFAYLNLSLLFSEDYVNADKVRKLFASYIPHRVKLRRYLR